MIILFQPDQEPTISHTNNVVILFYLFDMVFFSKDALYQMPRQKIQPEPLSLEFYSVNSAQVKSTICCSLSLSN